MSRARRVLVAVVLALLSAGCLTPDVVGRLDGLDMKTVFKEDGQVAEGVTKAVVVGWRLAGALAVILALRCWWIAFHPSRDSEGWAAAIKEYVVSLAVVCALLGSMGLGSGPLEWAFEAGQWLGDYFKPNNSYLLEVLRTATGKLASIARDLQSPKSLAGLALNLEFRWVEAVAYLMTLPITAILMAANAWGIFLMKMVLQVGYAWLIAFYWMVGPLVVPFYMLPQTRPVFVGWLKTYISVALWPCFFALAERLAVAIPWSTWLGTDVYRGDPISGVSALAQGELMFFVINVTFFFVYLGIPVASYLLVSGASKPFRGVL